MRPYNTIISAYYYSDWAWRMRFPLLGVIVAFASVFSANGRVNIFITDKKTRLWQQQTNKSIKHWRIFLLPFAAWHQTTLSLFFNLGLIKHLPQTHSSGIPEIQVCTGYTCKNRVVEKAQRTARIQHIVKCWTTTLPARLVMACGRGIAEHHTPKMQCHKKLIQQIIIHTIGLDISFPDSAASFVAISKDRIYRMASWTGRAHTRF